MAGLSSAKSGKNKRRGVNRRKLPVKRSINLVAVNEKPIRPGAAIPAVAMVLALAALLGKFGVYDRLEAVARAEREVTELRAQLDRGYAEMAGFGELTEEYAHYTYSGMTEEEMNRADRMAVAALVRRDVQNNAAVNSWAVRGNELRLSITGASLNQVNEIVRTLNADSLVSYCTMTNASTDTGWRNAQEAAYTDVVAEIVVYLNDASGEENGK